MKFMLDFKNYSVNEELTNVPLTIKYTNKESDKEHEKLARKKEEHKWVKAGDKKGKDKDTREQKYKCKCGKTKTCKYAKGKKMEVIYDK